MFLQVLNLDQSIVTTCTPVLQSLPKKTRVEGDRVTFVLHSQDHEDLNEGTQSTPESERWCDCKVLLKETRVREDVWVLPKLGPTGYYI